MNPAILDRIAVRPFRRETLTIDAAGDDFLLYDPAQRCLDSNGAQCVEGSGVASWKPRLRGASMTDDEFVQATGGAQPIFHKGRFPYMTFDGSDDYLRHAGTISTAVNGAIWLAIRFYNSLSARAVIATCDEGVASNTKVWGMPFTGTQPFMEVRRDEAQVTDDRYRIVDINAGGLNAPFVVKLVGDNVAWRSTVNGKAQTPVQVTGVNAGGQMWGSVTARDSWSIGGQFDAGGLLSPCKFDLYEFAIMGGIPPADEEAAIDDYFAAKYRFLNVAHLGASFQEDGANGYNDELREALAPQWVRVFMHGVAGQVASQVRTRFDSDVSGKGYHAMILQTGVSDSLNGTSDDTTFGHIAYMCNTALSQGTQVLLANVGPMGGTSSWSAGDEAIAIRLRERLQRFAADKGITFLDIYAEMANKDMSITQFQGPTAGYAPHWSRSDGLHLNLAGQAQYARYVAGRVLSTLSRHLI